MLGSIIFLEGTILPKDTDFISVFKVLSDERVHVANLAR